MASTHTLRHQTLNIVDTYGDSASFDTNGHGIFLSVRKGSDSSRNITCAITTESALALRDLLNSVLTPKAVPAPAPVQAEMSVGEISLDSRALSGITINATTVIINNKGE